ncbi:uncharacterized protein TRUGW13939_09049 [Talaromyces rugulosus]|uniref:Transcription factor domain-containing protein n=1 Tax=Talaromyces rugulosus TaxID=121627 RepID=A0A7H8RBK4_TALRU|nr:uncharacterized protein TRUGW13939_09049 [Talaromyces rugulosus]QKX61893.1 hypothetical protein TRUGW13939_09049 [Talaromyces rugulosus]
MTQQFQTETERHAFWSFANFAPSLANFSSAEIWNTYALQISYAEPAIQHIILSIGHLLNIPTADPWSGSNAAPDEQQHIVFYHYGKALHSLINNPNPDVNVVLLSCLIFCLFEELQGNCYAALQHVIAGRDILLRHIRSLKPSAARSNNLGSIKPSSTWDPLLAQLLQLFSYLEMHTPVLEGRSIDSHVRLPLPGFSKPDVTSRQTARQLSWRPHAPSLGSNNESTPSTYILNEAPLEFGSITDASQCLAGLAAACSADMRRDLLSESIPRWRSNFVVPSPETILLNHWLERFNRFMTKFSADDITQGVLIDCHILRTYHGCLTLINRAKHIGQEIVLDDNLVFFDLTMFRITVLISVAKDELISPLFFVATRCRVTHTRLRAVGFLRQCGHEGQFLADVAERIIENEESNGMKDGEQQATPTGFPIPEESRLRLHGINPPIGDDDVSYLMVSRFPYYPRVPTTPLPVHLSSVRENHFSNKARSCLDRALRFEMYSSVP